MTDLIALAVKASTHVWDTWPEPIDTSNVNEVRCAAMAAALRAASAPAAAVTREEIAKIIAPHDMGAVEYHGTVNVSTAALTAAGIALRKAETILSLLPSREAIRREEWQPIESAPKDGTEIIGIFFQQYEPGAKPTIYGPWTVAFSYSKWRASWDEQRVIESQSDFGTDYKEPDIAPTHWLPLPVPPATQPESGR